MTAVYLDYNATAPIRPEAAEAAACALGIGGNPSSIHAAGRLARAAVERARDQVSALVGVKPGSLTFTSGAPRPTTWPSTAPSSPAPGGR